MEEELAKEKKKLLEQFGFRVGDRITHKKMPIELSCEVIHSFHTTEECKEYIKQILRNQCLLGKGKPLSK